MRAPWRAFPSGACYLDGTIPIDDGRWHHVAVVYTGGKLPDGTPELTCYLDGRPQTMIPGFRTDVLSPDEPGAFSIRTDQSSPKAKNLTLFPTKWGRKERSRHMPLSIDELYVFETALSAAEVRTLYQHNSLPGAEVPDATPSKPKP
jgi:hypothetical protein